MKVSKILYKVGSSTQTIAENVITRAGVSPWISLYDGQIAWAQFDEMNDHELEYNLWEIYFWNGSEIIQLTDNEAADRYPSLCNGKIAWVLLSRPDFADPPAESPSTIYISL